MKPQKPIKYSSEKASEVVVNPIRQQTQETTLQHKPFAGSEAPIQASAAMEEPLNRLGMTLLALALRSQSTSHDIPSD